MGYSGPFMPSFDPVQIGARGGNFGGGAPMGGGAAVGGSGPIVRFLPEERPIPTAQEFNLLGQQTTVAVQANQPLVGATLTLPSGFVARVAAVVLYVAGLGAGSQLSFSLTVNDGAVQGWTNVAIFPGAAARVSEGYDAHILVPNTGVVEAFFTNADGGAYTVGVQISGWQWAEQDGKRWVEQGT